MSWYNEPKNIIVEFLRTRLTDPRSRAESTTTDTFSGTGASQILTLTPATNYYAYAITDVSVASSSIIKWTDYTVDLQNQNVSGTFASGTDNVVVTYKTGTTNWIYPGLSKTKITSTTAYPRIDILLVSSMGDRLGAETSTVSAEIYERLHFQANIWVKEDYYYDDGTNKWGGSALGLYLARQIVQKFQDYGYILYPYLYDFKLLMIRDAIWESERQAYHVIVEFELSGNDIGG